MSYTHTLTVNHTHVDSNNRATRSTSSYTKTGGRFSSISELIPDGSTDLQVFVDVDTSQLLLLMIEATGNLTIKTNSSSTPDDTINLSSVNGIAWASDMPLATNPLSEDVTSIFVTNATGADVTLTINALMDPTP